MLWPHPCARIRQLNEMVPNRSNFSLAQKTDFVNLSPKQEPR